MNSVSAPAPTEFRDSHEARVLELTLQLTRLGLTAPDLGSVMVPVLNALVSQTSAVGAGYFQLADQTLAHHARASSGVMSEGPAMAGPRIAAPPAADWGPESLQRHPVVPGHGRSACRQRFSGTGRPRADRRADP